MPRIKAVIWSYFVVSERNERFAVCQLCNENVSRGGKTMKTFGTSNLIDHLRKKHPTDFRDYEEKKKVQELTVKQPKEYGKKQLTLTETEARVQPWDINDARALRVHKKIAEMMALDFQPLSIVSDVGFIRLLNTLEPRYKLPSRRYFTEKIIPDIKQSVDLKIAELIKSVQYLSFTTDIWSTSLNNQSLISLTAHWIDDSCARRSAVLHVQRIEGSHNGAAICQMIETMLDSWKISKERVHLVLTDNASNMKKALRDCNLCGYGCFAHSLQLVVHDGVLSQRMVIDTLAVSRKIVGHFKHSTLAYHLLDEIKERLGIPKHKLQQDEPTRWNSILFMLESIYEQKMALAAYATEHGGITMLNHNQLDIARKIISALKPVEEITKIISTSSACISAVIPLIKILEKALNKHEDDAGILTMKAEMLSSLQRRFDNIEEINELSIATILDPRFKDKFFTKAETKQVARKFLIDNCHVSEHLSSTTDLRTDSVEPRRKRLRPDSSSSSTTECTDTTEDDDTSSATSGTFSSKIWECYTELLEEVGATSDTSGGVEAVIDRYLCEPLIDYKSGDPLKWWNENIHRFPYLVNLAKRFLSAPPTSVPSERLFSGAGILYDEQRNRLSTEHAEMLLCIKYNYNL